jgi:arylsulfatase A-like enzyme
MPGLCRTFVCYLTPLLRAIAAWALLLGIVQNAGDAAAQERKIIIFVWDGLRPDSINPADTPNLHALREAGVEFTDNHSTYPTFTMMNAASFATGGFPGSTGYYGNTVWQPGAEGVDSANAKVDFQQPVFSEDYAILDDLTRFLKGDLLLIDTLFEAAQKAGMVTATVGKTGAAFIQDYRRGGLLLDEKTALPLSFAKELQAAGISLPATTAKTYAPNELTLAPNNGNPVEFKTPKRLKDGVTFDPTDSSGSPYKAGLQYMADVYIDYILPKKSPRLSVLWIRDPDTSQHVYGVGSPNARDALRSTDAMLGQLRARLKQLGEEATTDIIVVSDHGHSNVAGSSKLFPLRAIQDGAVGGVDPNGYSVSGLVRLAELMHRAGFTAYDGIGCTYLPVALGIKADGAPVYPVETDLDGKLCGKEGQKYNIGPHKVPASLPPNALVIAVNGGSDYIYAPDRDAATVRKAVEFLQTRSEIGAIFVDSRYGALPGTLPLNLIRVENTAGRNPDVIVSYDYDPSAVIGGVKGTEYSGSLLNNPYRGMHGSFSPVDVHNTLIAYGPDFREGLKDPLPTGNVDVAPTVAGILGLELPRADGRPLLEALRNGPGPGDYQVVSRMLRPDSVATGISVKLPTDPGGREIDPDQKEYTIELATKLLTYRGRTYTYFDSAKAVRQ